MLFALLSAAPPENGQAHCQSCHGGSRFEVTGAVDIIKTGEDAGVLAGLEPTGIKITNRLQELLAAGNADVLIDFTSPLTVMDNIHCALKHRVAPVVGTTGFSADDLEQIRRGSFNIIPGPLLPPILPWEPY